MRSHPKQSEFNFDFLFDCKYAKHLPSLIWPQLQVENCCQSWGSQQQSWNCPWIWHFRIHGEKMMQPATCPVFWWAANDSKVCILATLWTKRPELDIMLPSSCSWAQFSINFPIEEKIFLWKPCALEPRNYGKFSSNILLHFSPPKFVTMYFVVFVSQNLWKILSLLDSHGLSGCFNEYTWSS